MKKYSSPKHTHAPGDVALALSLFSSVRRIMRVRFAKGKKLDPSTWLRIETLKFIADQNEPRMKDVADYLSITAPSATALIGGLIRSGLVRGFTGRQDRRTSRLVLTAKGKTELRTAAARALRLLGGMFSPLSKKEFSAFATALKRIKDEGAEA
ncbi:MAG: winged helix-turn-helix transcriptional regulator [Patescibacteria group bacterium]|nr:winged helix-turn-helix transcriptional regulator [Patescibacteria group bacterium]